MSMVSEFLKKLFNPRNAKREAQRLLDAAKPQVLQEVDSAIGRVCDYAEASPEKAQEYLQGELMRVIARMRNLPVLVRAGLEMAVLTVQIPDGPQSTVQQRIRREGERIKSRIKGARL